MPKKKGQQQNQANVSASKENASASANAEPATLDQQNAVAAAKASALPTNVGAAEEQKVSPDVLGQYEKSKANIDALESEEDDDVPVKKNLGERRGSRFDLMKDEENKGEDDQQATLYRPEFGKPAKGQEKIWELMSSYIGGDQRSIQRSIVNHVEYTLARTRFDFDDQGAYKAVAHSVRDRLIEAWNDTQQFHTVSRSFHPFLFQRWILFCCAQSDIICTLLIRLSKMTSSVILNS